MPRQLSNEFKAALNAQETDEVFITLLTITHPNFEDDIRISSDPTQTLPEADVLGTIFDGQEYIFIPFTITLPQEDDTGVSRATISVDNVGGDMIAEIRGATAALSVSIVIALASDLDNPEIQLDGFKLENISYDANTIEADLSMEYFELEPFPSKDFTNSDFPGMF